MKSIILSLAMSALALPAFAQSDTATQGTDQTDANRQQMEMTQEKLRTQLSKAGFKEVQILEASYLVQAQTEDGDPVLMVINPPDVSTTSSTSGGGASEQNQNSTKQ